LKAEIENDDPDVPTAEELPKLISKAQKWVKEIQKEAKEEREKFLAERAADH
jgi:Sec-independent protein translocase protein TatA